MEKVLQAKIKSSEGAFEQYRLLWYSYTLIAYCAALFWVLAKLSDLHGLIVLAIALPLYVISTFALGHLIYVIYGEKDLLYKRYVKLGILVTLVLFSWSMTGAYMILALMYLGVAVLTAFNALKESGRAEVWTFSVSSMAIGAILFIWEMITFQLSVPAIT